MDTEFFAFPPFENMDCENPLPARLCGIVGKD
jgi:hypothetical protein